VITFFCALAWQDGERLDRVFHARFVAHAPLHVFYTIGVQFELAANRHATWRWAVGICLSYLIPSAAVCCLALLFRQRRVSHAA